jgi:ABC-type nitrate/sulfonate/bicarbonate transport system permease component
MKTYQQYEYDLLLKGKNHLSNITKIILPLSSSYILLGFMQAMGLGIKVEIMSETFAYSSTYQGLGKTIYMYYQNVEYKEMMSYVLLAVLVSLILDGILLGVQRKVEKETGVTREESRRFWLGF